ncbi:hypothetical protein FOZ62_023787, partial [Perkinsus olseni]
GKVVFNNPGNAFYHIYNAYNKYTTYNTTYFVTSLLDKGLKVLVMNGDQDYITNSVGAEAWVLNLKGADKLKREVLEIDKDDKLKRAAEARELHNFLMEAARAKHLAAQGML